MPTNSEIHLTSPFSTKPLESCAVYARFSSEMQRNSSIEDQVKQCRDYAVKHGLFAPDDCIYKDEGVSGRSMERPGLQQLMAVVRTKNAPFRDLIIADTSRLSRDNSNAQFLRKFFDHHGVHLHFADTGMESHAASFGLQHTFHGVFDEEYSRSLGDKVSRGQKGCIKRGYVPAGRCYGYRNVPDEDPSRTGMYGRPEVLGVRQVINPLEAAVVQRIFELYANGEGGYQYIARVLNSEGVPPPRKPHKLDVAGWNHATVRNMLSNQKYRGVVVFNRVQTVRNPETGKIEHRPHPESEWITQDAPQMRIVEEALWDKAVSRRDFVAKQQGPKKTGGLCRTDASRSYLFSGLLRCGQCGGSMTLTGGPSGSYMCNVARRHMGCTNKLRLSRPTLEKQLIDALCGRIRSEFHMSTMKDFFMKELREEQRRQKERLREVADQRVALTSDREKLSRKVENLTKAIAEHGYSASLGTQLAEYETQVLRLNDLLREQPPLMELIGDEEINSFLERAMRDLSLLLTSEPKTAKQELQKRLTKLIVTPVLIDGRPAYEVTGDLSLFVGEESVLLGSTLHSTTKQHAYSLSLGGITLILSKKGKVLRVEDNLLRGHDEILPKAA